MEIQTDRLTLKPSDMFKAVTACVQARENVAVVGPPGTGKSSIIGQVATALDWDVLVSLAPLEDPTEPGGFPWISADHKYAEKVMFSQAYKALNAKKATIWHLEDFGQAEPAVQKAYMQWAQAREIDGKRLPDYVSITMATNRREDKAGVSGILEPIKSRFTLLHLRSDLDDFKKNLFDRGETEYGLTENAVLAGASFLSMKKDLLNAFKPEADMTNTPTERNWVAALKFVDSGLPSHIEHALIAGRVGIGAAIAFKGFLERFRQMTSIDSILIDPSRAVIPDNPSALSTVAVGLASKATETNFDKICCYAERLEQKALGEYATLLVRDSARHNARVASTKAWIKLMSGPVGNLLTGSAN